MFADASILVIIPLYFIFISKDWVPFQLFAVFATFLTLLATLVIPESPKYLYSKGNFLSPERHYSSLENLMALLKSHNTSLYLIWNPRRIIKRFNLMAA
jgi:hypothetical protein